ncbi:MAG: hypothetical protein HUJ95_03210, partial [Bacteroidales bacterium]|nr:hypothetical protein [Bacteroidales bacterium]
DASWMDHHRNDKDIAYTTAWHVYNVDKNHNYDPNPRAYKGDTIFGLWIVDYNLSDGKWREATDSAVVMNVRMLIHFAGDFHCPVHSYIDGHRTFWPCAIGDKEYATFHSIYDGIPALLYPDQTPNEIAEIIDNCTPAQRRKICKGSLYDWARECGDNNSAIYKINDYDEPVLDLDTIEKSREIVNIQLRNAGYRLAYLLNKYFGK